MLYRPIIIAIGYLFLSFERRPLGIDRFHLNLFYLFYSVIYTSVMFSVPSGIRVDTIRRTTTTSSQVFNDSNAHDSCTQYAYIGRMLSWWINQIGGTVAFKGRVKVHAGLNRSLVKAGAWNVYVRAPPPPLPEQCFYGEVAV